MFLQVKENTTNRITLFSRHNYAFRSSYSSDFYFDIPLTGSSQNSYIYFRSDEPGVAQVDWGDGITEDYKFIDSTSGYYICAFRAFYVDYSKNPESPTKGWGFGNNRETGEVIIPYPNHHYEDDDVNTKRTITFTFSNNIKRVNSYTIVMVEFPVLEVPSLDILSISNTSNIPEIPIDRISRLANLTNLTLNSLGNRVEYIPDSIFELTTLTTLSWIGGLNLYDAESSNIRKIKNLKNLTSLQLRSCNLTTYLKEFNELPKLKTLYIGNGSNYTDGPDFDEVSQINQGLTDFDWIRGSGGTVGSRTNWGEQISGKGIQNLTTFSVSHGRSLVLDLPEYLKEMRSLKSFSIQASLHTQDRTDTFINNFYNYITNWEYITKSQTANDGLRNQFYGLSVSTYQAAYPDYSKTPSGILQSPEGFEKGVSDGNPTTPMEKIYALTQNYNQKWTIKPADTDALSDTISSPLEYNQIADNSMIVSKEGVIYRNEVITLSEEEL